MNVNPPTPVALTPAGRLRQGFRYQDLLAIERMVEWLFDTQRFRWIKAEADDGGFLDDVQAMRDDGVLEIWQVKFSTVPGAFDDPYSWEMLLHRDKGRRGLKPSLLQKWHKMWRGEQQKQPVEAALISNRRASPELEACLSPRTTQARFVLWDSITSSVQADITAQLGSEKTAREFLAQFRWRLDEPQLQELEQSIFARFERIGGTRGGWKRLCLAARSWIENRNDPPPDGRVSLEDVRRAAGLRAHPVKLHTFLPPSAFFERYTLEGRLFHHRSPLVGRRAELRALLDFASDPARRVALLPGRGGNGKSRLIAGLCRRLARLHPDLPVRIVAENVALTEAALAELPDEKCLVVLDDAHRGHGLDVVLGAARQNPQMKVLLIARPHAVEFLKAQIGQFSFDSTETQMFSPLADLSFQQVRRLARSVLGPQLGACAEELATATRDCPLLTILGGQLLRDQQIAPSHLAHNATFRQEVLGRFRDITLGEAVARMDGRFSPALCAGVLPFVALTTPLDRTDTQLLKAIATLIQTDESTLERLLDALVSAGVLLRGGRFVRLIPDVLSDFILQEACFSSDGRPTSWADRAFASLRDVCPDNVLRNLAELDWRVRSASSTEEEGLSVSDGQRLLSRIWHTIESEFGEGTLSQRQSWLSRVEPWAFTHPEPVWRLIQIARDQPKLQEPEDADPFVRRYSKSATQISVMNAAIPLLRHIARHERFTERCCDLLWELGRDYAVERAGGRPGALATLQEIASYQDNKPFAFQMIVAGCCRNWLRDPKAHDYGHSVLGVVGRLLERTPQFHSTDEQYISASPHPSSKEWWNSLWKLRREALDRVEACARSPRPDVVLRAIECLKKPVSEEGLHRLNRGEHEKDELLRQKWEEEQLRAINIAASVAETNADPFVRLAVCEALHHQSRGPRDKVRERAREAFEAVPDSFEMKMVRVYAQSRRHVWVLHQWNDEEEDERWKRSGEEMPQLCSEVAQEFVSRFPDARDGFADLESWRRRIESSLWWTGVEGSSWKGMWTMSNDFLLRLTFDFPEYAGGLCEAAMEKPESPFASSCSDILAELRRHDVAFAAGLALRLMETQHPNLCHTVAQSYAWRGWPLEPTPEDWSIIEMLLASPHPVVKQSAAQVLSSIAVSAPRRAVEMALNVEVGPHSLLAESLFKCFEAQLGFDFTLIQDEELAFLLEKLEAVQSVGSYYVGRFVLQAMLRAPLATTQMLLRRLEAKARISWERDAKIAAEGVSDLFSSREHDVLPGPGFREKALEALAEHPHYRQTLQMVRDSELSQRGLSFGDNVATLFHALSFGWNETSLEVLEEWINSGDGEKIQGAAALLEMTFVGFYAEHLPLVSNFLKRAQECDSQVLQKVQRSLLHHAVYGPPRMMASHRGEHSNALVDGASLAFGKGELDELTHRFFKRIETEGRQRLRREAEEREAEAVFFHR